MRSISVLCNDEDASNEMRVVLGDRHAAFREWGEYGNCLLINKNEPPYLECHKFRAHLYGLMIQHVSEIKHLFPALPLKSEADMGTASSKARALGFQGEPSDPATAWAIAVLDPKTYMTDSLWLSFALLEFHNKVSVYVFTRIQENQKANKFRYFARGLQLQPLMHQGAEDVVVIPVVRDEYKDDVMHYTQAEFAKEKGGVRLITLRGEISSGNGLAAANVGQASMTQGGALNGEEGRTELLEDKVCDGVGDNSGASESGSDGGSDSSKSPVRKRTEAEDLAEL